MLKILLAFSIMFFLSCKTSSTSNVAADVGPTPIHELIKFDKYACLGFWKCSSYASLSWVNSGEAFFEQSEEKLCTQNLESRISNKCNFRDGVLDVKKTRFGIFAHKQSFSFWVTDMIKPFRLSLVKYLKDPNMNPDKALEKAVEEASIGVDNLCKNIFNNELRKFDSEFQGFIVKIEAQNENDNPFIYRECNSYILDIAKEKLSTYRRRKGGL